MTLTHFVSQEVEHIRPLTLTYRFNSSIMRVFFRDRCCLGIVSNFLL